ncbi:MAG: hypothetical protein WC881_03385 [Elusimicrobiota bacterium]|jgi:hypothetical protein
MGPDNVASGWLPGPLLDFKLTQGLALKSGASLVLSVAGMYFLASGKKNQSLNYMLSGAAMILLSMFCFF